MGKYVNSLEYFFELQINGSAGDSENLEIKRLRDLKKYVINHQKLSNKLVIGNLLTNGLLCQMLQKISN